MIYQISLIDLLDRRYTLLNDVPDKEFFLELENFIEFLQTNEQLKLFVDYLDRKLNEKLVELTTLKGLIIHDLKRIRSEAEANLPKQDVHEIEKPDHKCRELDHPYYKTFNFFDEKVLQQLQQLNDISKIKEFSSIDWMIKIIAEHLPNEQIDADLEYWSTQLSYLEQQKVYLERKIQNYFRSSSEVALVYLQNAVKQINPKPQLPQQPSKNPQVGSHIRLLTSPEHRSRRLIQAVTYEKTINEEFVNGYRFWLRRAYEGLRAEVGSTLIHHEIMMRYKTRCMFYSRHYLQNLVKGISKNQSKEEILTRDLATYLFDQGISTFYRIKRGNHEYDLVKYDLNAPLFVEVKVYTQSKDLTQGFAQLHAYLNGQEAENLFLKEVYYVIYRLGGPLYDLPPYIHTNRRTYYLIIIDLAVSSESGSKQPKPIYISPEKFFDALPNDQVKNN